MKNPLRISLAVLALIVIGGTVLRCFNLDFPSIGYHNMKENEYLSMAQAMHDSGNLGEKKIYFYNAFGEGTGIGVNKQLPLVMYQVPMVSYQILAAWNLFGENLWGPRMVNVIFGSLSIIAMFFIARLLLADLALALFSSLVLAVLPLAVFFSRNLQPESPAFFFMLLGSLCYLYFFRTFRKRFLVLGGVFSCVVAFYKMSFLFGVLPVAFCAPWRTLIQSRKKLLEAALWFIVPFAAVAAFVGLGLGVAQWKFNEIGRVRLFEVFTSAYWSANGRQIWWYFKDENFTVIYLGAAAIGMLTALARRKGWADRYLIGSLCAAVPYCMAFSDFINQHNYYQMPFLPMVCIGAAAGVGTIAAAATHAAKKDFTVVCCLLTALAAAPLCQSSIMRMFGTVFLGTDVAGESLEEFTSPGERVFLDTYAQGYAISRYAKRPMGWADTLQEFKEKEQKYNIRYLCFYPAEFAQLLKKKDPEFFAYMQSHYHVKEVGLTEEPRKVFYLIMERGAGSDAKDFLTSFSGQMSVRTIYKPFGRYLFFYSLRVPPPDALAQAPALPPPAPAAPAPAPAAAAATAPSP